MTRAEYETYLRVSHYLEAGDMRRRRDDLQVRAQQLAADLATPYPSLRQSATRTIVQLAVNRAHPPALVCEDVVEEAAVACCHTARGHWEHTATRATCYTLASLACRTLDQVEGHDGSLEERILMAVAIAASDLLGLEHEM